VTVAAFLIRAGLHGGGGSTTTERGAVTHPSAATTSTRRGTTTAGRRFYTVQSGDTFGAIAAKTGISVSELQRLNPGVSSNALRVGQKLRVK
jgi:LysM repeat protein